MAALCVSPCWHWLSSETGNCHLGAFGSGPERDDPSWTCWRLRRLPVLPLPEYPRLSNNGQLSTWTIWGARAYTQTGEDYGVPPSMWLLLLVSPHACWVRLPRCCLTVGRRAHSPIVTPPLCSVRKPNRLSCRLVFFYNFCLRFLKKHISNNV